MKNGREREAGFTLVEVLVVIFILSLIMALVVPNYTQSSSRAQMKLCQLNKKNLEAQLELYSLDNGGLPQGSDETVFQTLVDEGYLKEVPKCPSGGTYSIEEQTETSPEAKAQWTVLCSFHDGNSQVNGSTSPTESAKP